MAGATLKQIGIFFLSKEASEQWEA